MISTGLEHTGSPTPGQYWTTYEVNWNVSILTGVGPVGRTSGLEPARTSRMMLSSTKSGQASSDDVPDIFKPRTFYMNTIVVDKIKYKSWIWMGLWYANINIHKYIYLHAYIHTHIYIYIYIYIYTTQACMYVYISTSVRFIIRVRVRG